MLANLLYAAALAPTHADGNPVPEREARALNQQPADWIAHPTPELRRNLVWQFSNYGIQPSLLSPSTLEILDRNFDRFAPVMIEAQRPPNAVDLGLQSWFRTRANRAQSDSMRAALRQWLTAPIREAHLHGGMRIDGPPEAVAQAIEGVRACAAEALGDWRDRPSLPALKMLASRDANPPLVLAAIRRIEDPAHTIVGSFDRSGFLTFDRPTPQPDSAVVEVENLDTNQRNVWRPDRARTHRLWNALNSAEDAWTSPRPRVSWERSVMVHEVKFFLRGGVIVHLEHEPPLWDYHDSGHSEYPSLRLYAPALDKALDRAWTLLPEAPHFTQELVRIRVQSGEMQVEGFYMFEDAPRGGWVSLRYPIASSRELGSPEVDAVTASAGTEPLGLSYEVEPSGLRIGVKCGSAPRWTLQVSYRQRLHGRRAIYLIRTARDWGRPLRSARFEFSMDDGLPEPRFSFPLRPGQCAASQRCYTWSTLNFAADSDFVATW